jgi:hypothetical protein
MGHFSNMFPSPARSHFSAIHKDMNAPTQYEVEIVVFPALGYKLVIGG